MSEDRVVLHLDMDAFYASVEQRERPELRGRPVVVGADPQQGEGRGVVAAASYEARKYGIHSAQPISRAWRNCPGAEYVRPRFDLYEAASREVFAILEDAVDVLEPVSIDEAYADVTERCSGSTDAGRRLADALRDRVREELALTCSIGVAPNKLAAKVASDEDKPDGTTAVEPGEVRAFLADRPADAIPGVGDKTARALADHGVETVEDLAARESSELGDVLGSWATRVVEMARGRDPRPVDPERERKSVGAERTFAEDLQPGEARDRLLDVARETTRRLHDTDRQARTIAIKVRLHPFETFTRQRTLAAPTDDGDVLARVAGELYDVLDPDRRVRLVGVRASDLTQGEAQQASLDRWPADVVGEAEPQRPWERDDYWRFA